MALFYGDFISLCVANVRAEKQWWMTTFDCKDVVMPTNWDCPLPSDVALTLPGPGEQTILLSDKAEVAEAGYQRQNSNLLVFSTDLKKSQEYLRSRGASPGPIQDSGGTQFFELRDPEGNVIEICKEP